MKTNPEIRVALDNTAALRGLQRIPEAVERHVDAELGEVANRGAVMMKDRLITNRSMARSTLVHSIRAAKVALMHWFAGAGVNYGRAVEEGTGPAAGRAGYMPDPEKLQDYIRQRPDPRTGKVIRMAGKPGSPTRRRVIDEIRDRAWGLAIHIRRHGTRAHPFVAPAAEQLRRIAPDRVADAVQRGLQEAFKA